MNGEIGKKKKGFFHVAIYLALKVKIHTVGAVGHLVLCYPLSVILSALCNYFGHFEFSTKIHLNPL